MRHQMKNLDMDDVQSFFFLSFIFFFSFFLSFFFFVFFFFFSASDDDDELELEEESDIAPQVEKLRLSAKPNC